MQKRCHEPVLTGENIVIGIADTGLDMSHCHFYDPNHNTPINTVNNNHRKVVLYAHTTSGPFQTDTTDQGFGHGTFVASVAAGNPLYDYGDFQKYRGVAFNAKIAFFDIGISFDNPLYNTLRLPSNWDTGLFGVLYNAGAKILSMSWGGSVDKYDLNAIAVDQFMYDNTDVLIIFAAGNNGSTSNTIGSPANCKNCLTIGAHLNDEKSFPYASLDLINQLNIESVAGLYSLSSRCVAVE